jgi:hypothetical protein
LDVLQYLCFTFRNVIHNEKALETAEFLMRTAVSGEESVCGDGLGGIAQIE